jgi:hypothetical protein
MADFRYFQVTTFGRGAHPPSILTVDSDIVAARGPIRYGGSSMLELRLSP